MKRTTIFRQLILNFIVPMVLAIGVFSALHYYLSVQKLEESYQQQKQLITKEVEDLLLFYDYAMTVHESSFSERMEALTGQLVNDYFNGAQDPATADLYAIAQELGMDTTVEFMYVIDTNGVVVNTTFEKDREMDFYAISDYFRTFFQKVRDEKVFLEDRFSFERTTGSIKKYSYQVTRNGRYIIELGFYSRNAIELKQLLEEKAAAISSQYKYIRQIRLIMAANILADVPFFNQEQVDILNEVVGSKKDQQVEVDTSGQKVLMDFIFLPILESPLFEGYVIYIESDDSLKRELISSELRNFGLITLLTVLPLLLIVFFRARSISRPIRALTQKVEVITSGHLEERVEVSGRNEITTLSEGFNTMVSQLQESYNTLEQKVIDRTKELHEQKELVEEKQKEILDSINYAQRLQQAILATPEEIDKHLRNNFLFYLPKDIVAGDFYFFESTDKHLFYAAADCTGHGVPGAMVSMVCANALNRCVYEFNLSDPGAILDKAREIVVATFEKSGAQVRDGMDISLLVLDKEMSKVYWAGANNPLWILNPDKGEMREIKANKQPIGKTEDPQPFTTHQAELEKGEVLYLFTDGYPDQFGGPKGKKFKYSNFQKLLIDSYSGDLKSQMITVKNTFQEWRGDLEQVDDVCVIGIQF